MRGITMGGEFSWLILTEIRTLSLQAKLLFTLLWYQSFIDGVMWDFDFLLRNQDLQLHFSGVFSIFFTKHIVLYYNTRCSQEDHKAPFLCKTSRSVIQTEWCNCKLTKFFSDKNSIFSLSPELSYPLLKLTCLAKSGTGSFFRCPSTLDHLFLFCGGSGCN